MSTDKNPKWINWSTRLQAIAQTGLTVANDPYGIERYHAISERSSTRITAGQIPCAFAHLRNPQRHTDSDIT